METIAIKRVTVGDISYLQKIGRRTFYETFRSANTEENMTDYLNENFSADKLTSVLNDPNSELYFAMTEQKIVGYLKLNSGDSQTELQDGSSLEIERIYVLQQYHGKKVGQALYEKAMQVAAEKKVHYVWLGVWEENLRAIRFYQKNGFVAFDQHIFSLGSDQQTDIMMKKVL